MILARSVSELVGRPDPVKTREGGGDNRRETRVSAAEGNMQEVSRFGW